MASLKDAFTTSGKYVPFDSKTKKLLHEEEQNNRLFTKNQKEICWKNAAVISGRHPERWRFDAIGNPVLSSLRGCFGALCHEYDHIVPFSKGGQTVVSNCQVL